MKKLYPFDPDWDHEIHPGLSIKERMDMLDMSESKLAYRMEVSPDVVQQLLKGEAPITPEIAEKLHVALGIDATFWLNLGKDYWGGKAAYEAKEEQEWYEQQWREEEAMDEERDWQRRCEEQELEDRRTEQRRKE